ncbi:DUF7848 domain-containing protein [Streptomyces bauhiniae]
MTNDLIEYAVCADPDARQGVSHAWCMTCGMRSQEAEDRAVVKHWCLGHAGETGHKRFRAVVTTFLMVVPAPGRVTPARPVDMREAPSTLSAGGGRGLKP